MIFPISFNPSTFLECIIMKAQAIYFPKLKPTLFQFLCKYQDKIPQTPLSSSQKYHSFDSVPCPRKVSKISPSEGSIPSFHPPFHPPWRLQPPRLLAQFGLSSSVVIARGGGGIMSPRDDTTSALRALTTAGAK